VLAAGGWLRFEVRDTGMGIEPKDLPHLFDEYARFSLEKTYGQEGTGLGLAIVAKLIHAMGGTIEVESEPGKGSVFIVRLPQKVGEARSEGPGETSALGQASFAGVRCLVVDDVAFNIDVAREMLSIYGVECDRATSGAEAVRKVQEGAYQLVFMDYMMPGMDGAEALAQIRALGIGTPVVALTANAISGSREEMLAKGFDGYLSKPFEPEEILAVLREFVNSAPCVAVS
jgi:CheY-like chemotaxis protein